MSWVQPYRHYLKSLHTHEQISEEKNKRACTISLSQTQLGANEHKRFLPEFKFNTPFDDEALAHIQYKTIDGAHDTYKGTCTESDFDYVWGKLNIDIHRSAKIIYFGLYSIHELAVNKVYKSNPKLKKKSIFQLFEQDSEYFKKILREVIEAQIKHLPDLMRLRVLSVLVQTGLQRLYISTQTFLAMNGITALMSVDLPSCIKLKIMVCHQEVAFFVENKIRDIYPAMVENVNSEFSYLPIEREDINIPIERRASQQQSRLSHLRNCQPIITVSAKFRLQKDFGILENYIKLKSKKAKEKLNYYDDDMLFIESEDVIKSLLEDESLEENFDYIILRLPVKNSDDNILHQYIDNIDITLHGQSYLYFPLEYQYQVYNKLLLDNLTTSFSMKNIVNQLMNNIDMPSSDFVNEFFKLFREQHADFNASEKMSPSRIMKHLAHVFVYRLNQDLKFHAKLKKNLNGQFVNCLHELLDQFYLHWTNIYEHSVRDFYHGIYKDHEQQIAQGPLIYQASVIEDILVRYVAHCEKKNNKQGELDAHRVKNLLVHFKSECKNNTPDNVPKPQLPSVMLLRLLKLDEFQNISNKTRGRLLFFCYKIQEKLAPEMKVVHNPIDIEHANQDIKENTHAYSV